jgi:hypothetical protein
MSDSGTLGLVLRELATVLSPLTGDLTEEEAPGFFASLGIPMSPSQAASVAEAVRPFRTSLGQLMTLVNELTRAIGDEDTGAIVETSIRAGAQLAAVFDALPTIASAVGGLPGVTPQVEAALPARIFGLLLAEYLGRNEGVNELLEFTGILEREDVNVESTGPAQPFHTINTFHFDRIGGWFSSPGAQLESLYDWGAPGFDGTTLLPALDKFFVFLGFPSLLDTSGPTPVLDLVGIEIAPRTDVTPPGLAIRFRHSGAPMVVELSGPEWTIAIETDFALGSGGEILLQPDGAVTVTPPDATTLSGRIGIGFTTRRSEDNPLVLIGVPGGSRLQVGELGAAAEVNLQWGGLDAGGGFGISGHLKQGRTVLTVGEADGFLSEIMGGGEALEHTFDLGFSISSANGVHFHGSSALEIRLASHIELGPIRLTGLTLSLGIEGHAFPLSIGTNVQATLGPITAVVEDIGLRLDLALVGDGGNLGPVDLRPAFKPPRGVGLSVDAGPVKGGGYLFFDFDREEYAGALELVFSDWIALRAIGLITTRMPDGSSGFSMLIIITVEFGSGIQLGFGFTLLGVGGLLGVHRIVKVEPLKEGIRTGAVESVMFPQNIIANAPRIISDLKKFFPPQQGTFLIGPMVKIGWGTPTLFSASVGIIIEVPSVNITILGVIKVVLPDEQAAVLRLQVNFIGRIEPSNKLLWFYAELYDSRVLFITLEGGMGLLVHWGDQANFVVSVGGFHPRYTPPPLPFPAPPRLAVNILNESYARVRIEAYFAVTSNSVQFGAKAELFFGLSEFCIEGFLAFDALFRFDPFFFSFGLSISLSVKVFGVGLFSVGFSGLLEGPTPWHIEGKGKIKLLFFKISVPFSHTWGGREDTSLGPIEVFPLLERELDALTNWRARLPPGNSISVSLRKLGDTDSDRLVLHPVGTLRISQRKVPINFKMDRVGNQRPSDATELFLSADLPGGGGLATSEIRESFAVGQFLDLSDSERLSRPGFEPQDSGVEIAATGEQLKTSQAVKRVIRYESIIIDNNFKRFVRRSYDFFQAGYAVLNDILFRHFLTGNAATESVLSRHHRNRLTPFDELIEVKPNEYSVAFDEDNTPVDWSVSFSSHASAMQYMDRRIATDPALSGRLHVIPNTEVNLSP